MRAIDLFKKTKSNYFQKVNYLPKSYRSYASLAVTIFILAAIPLTVIVTPQVRSIMGRAFGGPSLTCPVSSVDSKEKLLAKVDKNKVKSDGVAAIAARKDLLTEDNEQSAKERKDKLIKAMRQSPEVALKGVMTESERDKFTNRENNCIEKLTEVEGVLEISYADYINTDPKKPVTGPTFYRLRTGKKSYEIHPAHDIPRAKSGQKVKIKGYQLDDDILVDLSNSGNIKVTGEANKKTLGASTGDVLAAQIGNKPTVVITTNFSGVANIPISNTTANNWMFNDSDNFYRENSYNKMSISGDVFGPYTIAADCNYSTVLQNAVNVADSAVNFHNYTNLMVLVPEGVCSFGGQASSSKTLNADGSTITVGAGYAVVYDWALDYSKASVAHEWGHSIGAAHTYLLDCGSSSISTSGCSLISGGDPYSRMSGGWYHFGASVKDDLGWFDASNVMTPTSSGNYALARFETDSANAKTIKIPRGGTDYLYIEYRRPWGYDAAIGSEYPGTNVYNGALIHIKQSPSGQTRQTILVDANPPNGGLTAALQVNQTFTDPKSGVSIKPTSKNDLWIYLDITIPITTGRILGRIWNDENGNGTREAGEPYIQEPGTSCTNSTSIAGFGVKMLSVSYDTNFKPNLCNPDAHYMSDALDQGNYWAIIVKPAGWEVTGTRQEASDPVWTVNANKTNVSGSLTAGLNKDIWFGVKLSDNEDPTVDITAPSNNSYVSGTSLMVTADASDNVGVTKVEFYLDGVKQKDEFLAPYEWVWDTTISSNNGYTLTAIAYDAAGNTTTSSAIAVIVDNAAPSVSITSPNSNDTVKDTITMRADAADNSGGSGTDRVVFKVDGSTQCTDSTASSFTCSWNTNGETDGSHTLTAIAYDNVGNSATSSSVSVTVDNTAPSVSITEPANGQNVSGTITLGATASDTTSAIDNVEFLVDGVVECTDSSSPYTCSWNSANVSDGSYTIVARAYDTPGNTNTDSISVNVNNDNIDPSVSISSPSDGVYISGTQTVTASASDNVGVTKVEFYLGSSATPSRTDTSSPYTWSWDTTQSSDGSYTITAKAYDAANNTKTSTAVNVTVDNTNPSSAVVSSPSDGDYVKDTITISASASDGIGIDFVEFIVNAVPISTDSSFPYTYSWNTNSYPNGSNTIQVKAWDNAGNTRDSSTITVTVDNQDPTLTITNPTNGATVSDTTNVTADATDGHSGIDYVEFLIDGQVEGTDQTANYTYSWDTTIYSNGSHTVAVNAWDNAGNFTTQSISVSVDNVQPDTQPPSTPTSLSADVVSSTQVDLTWDASTDNVGVVGYKVYRDGQEIASPSSTSFGDGTVNANTTYTYRVSAVDAAGNESTQSTAVTVTTLNPPDTQDPVVTITAPANGATLSNTVTITAAATDNVGVTGMTLFIGGQQKAISITGSISYSWDTIQESNGSYTILVNAADAAGNTGTSSISVTVDNQGPPPLEGDLNDDGAVNIFDASIMTAKWGTDDPTADINGDGVVNIFDASILTANWTG